jgi:hypothetical protein
LSDKTAFFAHSTKIFICYYIPYNFQPTPTREHDDEIRIAEVFVLKRDIGKNDGSVGIINHWSVLCRFQDGIHVVIEGIIITLLTLYICK